MKDNVAKEGFLCITYNR